MGKIPRSSFVAGVRLITPSSSVTKEQGAVRGVCVACGVFEAGASPALALIRACKCCYYHQEQSGSLEQRQNGAGAALLLLQRQGRQNS